MKFNEIQERIINERFGGFSSSKITFFDTRRLKAGVVQIGIHKSMIGLLRQSKESDSMQIKVNDESNNYAGLIFTFVKVARTRYFIYTQKAWLIHAELKNPERHIGWLSFRGGNFFDILWKDDFAELISSVEFSSLILTPVSYALRGVQKMHLPLQINRIGIILTIFIAVIVFLIID